MECQGGVWIVRKTARARTHTHDVKIYQIVQVEPKEDFSHLPPEQQRRKLQAKVDELDAAVQKTLSDKSVFNDAAMLLLNLSILNLSITKPSTVYLHMWILL